MRELSSSQNPLIKRLQRLVKDKEAREQAGRVVVAGENLLRDLVRTQRLRTVLVSDPRLAEALPADEQYLVSPELLSKVAGVRSLSTCVAELDLPPASSLADASRVLVLDRVSDPGNLGTLLRSAEAFGWDAVFYLDGCCDPFNDKALRAAKGATFRLPYGRGCLEELQQMGKGTALLADLEGEAPEAIATELPVLLIMSSEAHGVRPELRERCKAVSLPMSEGVDSLNVAVAGGILMYVLRDR